MLPVSNVEIFIRKHLRYNLIVNLADGGLFGLALGFASFSTIIPLFVTQLTNSAILIGLAPAIHTIGWQLPQLFNANRIARARKIKPMVLRNTLHERFPFLLLAIVAFLIPAIGKEWALFITFIALTWQGLGGGITANPWTSFIAKIIPAQSRGTFFGLQGGLVNLMVSISAVGAGYLLERVPYPNNYGYSFLIACAALAASYFAIAKSREPSDNEKIIPQEDTTFWSDTRAVLSRDKNFVWFLIVRALSQFSIMGFGFYILLGLRRFHMDTITAGYLTAALTLTQTFANAGMGWLGDRIGHRAILIFGSIAGVISVAIAWYAPSIHWLYPAFIISGFANVAVWTISLAFTVDFGSESERPTYIGLSNTLITPATILAPIIGGWLVDNLDFEPMLTLSAVIGIITAFILIFVIKDPRKTNRTRGTVLGA
jgi:MFS family permease